MHPIYIHVDDTDKVNLLDLLIMDWEDESMKLGATNSTFGIVTNRKLGILTMTMIWLEY